MRRSIIGTQSAHRPKQSETTSNHDTALARVMHRLEVDDLDALMAEWKARRPEFAQEITISPWNAKHVDLKDPFGNSLGINQILAGDADT